MTKSSDERRRRIHRRLRITPSPFPGVDFPLIEIGHGECSYARVGPTGLLVFYFPTPAEQEAAMQKGMELDRTPVADLELIDAVLEAAASARKKAS